MLWMSEAWRTLELNASALVLSDWKSQNATDAVQTVSFVFRRIVPRTKTQCRPQPNSFRLERERVA